MDELGLEEENIDVDLQVEGSYKDYGEEDKIENMVKVDNVVHNVVRHYRSEEQRRSNVDRNN